MTKTIKVKNIKGNFYGGFPYSINWNFNGGESPSTLTVNVVNEKGEYSTPELSYEKEITIKFDEFDFKGYLISYNLNKSVNQKTLELQYVDISSKLDKYFVVMHTKNGNKNGDDNDDSLIIVGKPYHPCDKDMDSTVDYAESSNKDIDWCDPCPYMPEDKYDYTCKKDRIDFEIFEVFYTINELIKNIKNILTIDNPQQFDKYKEVKRAHEGSLKSVLSSWCQDLGLAYYYDPVDNKLFFIDRTKPLEIPDFKENDKEIDIIDLNKGETLENTFSRGYIATYEKVGRRELYECKTERLEIVQCLVTQDLYDIDAVGNKKGTSKLGKAELSDGNTDLAAATASGRIFESITSLNEENDKIKNVADVEELLTAVSYLGENAHNAFLWFWYYQITSADALQKYLLSYEDESKPSGPKSYLTFFGNMKVRAIYSATSADEESRKNFNRAREKMDKVKKDLLDAEDKKNGYAEEAPSYYFMVAELNEDFYDKQVKDRINRAENFLGQYWYKKLDISYTIPGGTNTNSQINISAPDGANGKWYKENESVEGLEIFKFGHEENSKIGTFFTDIPNNQLEIENEDKKYWEKIKNFGPESILKEVKKVAHSFILVNREPKWFPDKRSFIYYESLFSWYRDVAPQVYSDQDGRPKWLFTLYPEAKTNRDIKIFICRDVTKNPDKAFEAVEFTTSDHPLEPKKSQQRTEEDQNADGEAITIKKGPWGLNGRKCVKIKLPGIDLYCPVQAFGNNKIIKDKYRPATKKEKEDEFTLELTGTIVEVSADDDTAGYRVFSEASAKFPKILPKLKYIYTKWPEEKNVAKIDYAIQDLSNERNMDQLQRKKCMITKENFETLGKKFEDYIGITQKDSQKKATFKVAGVYPKKYKISEGLKSVQINIGDDGAYTLYEFQDSIIESLNEQRISEIIPQRNPIGGQISWTGRQNKTIKDSAIKVSQNYDSVLYNKN